MDTSSRQNINNETQVLNDTLDYVDLTDMYGLSIQHQKNAHSFQVHMEPPPEYDHNHIIKVPVNRFTNHQTCHFPSSSF